MIRLKTTTNSLSSPFLLTDAVSSNPSCDKIIKGATSFLDNRTEASDPKMTDGHAVVEEAAKYPRGQRPGLDRKRPRFSLLPATRQLDGHFELTLDFDKLKDPEEFFSAYERLENAKKEIAKQTGRAFTDCDQHNVFNVPRSQRQGIEGRARTVKYQHLYPTVCSHETSEMDIQSNSNLQQEIANAASQQTQITSVALQDFTPTNDASLQTEPELEMELNGSVVDLENKVNKLLDDWLASEKLEGDGTFDVLQDMLQIRHLQVEKLHLPELQDIRRIDFRTSGINLSTPRNILLDINNLLKGIRNKTPIELKNAESSSHDAGLPPPPKSPLASLSLLKQRIFQSNDPFPAADIDKSPMRNASCYENFNEHSDPVNVEDTLCTCGDLNSKTNEEEADGVGTMNSTKMAAEDSTSFSKKHADENIRSLGRCSEIGSRKSVPLLDNNNVGIVMKENSNQVDADAGVQKNRPNESQDMAEEVWQEATTSAQHDQETVDVPEKMSNSIQNKNDCAMVESRAMNGCSEHLDGAQEQNQNTSQEQIVPEPSMTSIDERTKEKSRPTKDRKKKAVSLGQSLAGCGMSWESGVRRSARIKSRPLEYWKGERFLYGRIHGSLATVIGIKYASPGKDDEKPTLKVKSFVSDEYKGLVEQAALY